MIEPSTASLVKAMVCAEKYFGGFLKWLNKGKESLIDLVAFARLVVDEPDSTLKRTLQAVRRHLGMLVAYRRRLDDSAAL
jgi:hypothetical protein